jgi:hypothetical protein
MKFGWLCGFVPAILTVGLACLPPAMAGEKNKQQFVETSDRSDRMISEEEIKQIFNDMMVATERKDVEGVTKYLAPFAVSANTVRTLKGGNISQEVMRLKRLEQQRSYIQQSFINVDSYDFLYYDVKVRVSPDRKTAFANVTSIVDTRTIKGPRLLISSTGTTKFALVEGQLKIISDEAITDVESPPAFQPTVYNNNI